MVWQLVKCPVKFFLLLVGGVLLPHLDLGVLHLPLAAHHLLAHLTCPTELHQSKKEKAGHHYHVALSSFVDTQMHSLAAWPLFLL